MRGERLAVIPQAAAEERRARDVYGVCDYQLIMRCAAQQCSQAQSGATAAAALVIYTMVTGAYGCGVRRLKSEQNTGVVAKVERPPFCVCV